MRVATLALLLAIPTFVTAAPEHEAGDWVYEAENDGSDVLFAATENAAGQTLLQLCYVESKTCIYAVDFEITCEEDARYPALVNTDVGAKSIVFVCSKLQETHTLVATEFDAIDGLVRSGKRIGFAIPMEGDQFKAVRFSLVGATRALDSMRAATDRAGKKKRKGGTATSTSSQDSEVF